jgi:formate hydrogenlyase subunit 3/multisubunit Na+/H+ antiporter MnhD subunit
MLSSAAGYQIGTRTPVWFLTLVLVSDCFVVLCLVVVVVFLGTLRGVTVSTYLSTYYAATDSPQPIWLRNVFEYMEELGFCFRVDVIAAVFVVVVLIITSICLIFYELKTSVTLTCCLLLLKASACCAFCAANLFTFIVFTEISSVLMAVLI